MNYRTYWRHEFNIHMYSMVPQDKLICNRATMELEDAEELKIFKKSRVDVFHKNVSELAA